MEWSITELIGQASGTVKMVMVVLLVLSIATWASIFQRIVLLIQLQKEVRWFDRHLNEHTMDLNQAPPGRLKMLVTQWHDIQQSSAQDNGPPPQWACDTLLDEQAHRLMGPLSFLAMTSQVSPYIGLFGTVWGIMLALQALGDAQATVQTVAPGMAEALIATALGLLVAIPAAMAYNRLSVWVDHIISRYAAIIARWPMTGETAQR